MFNTLKLWAGGAIMALVGVFVAIFNYRSKKIERLESDSKTLKKAANDLKDVIEKQEKEIKTRETVNQIVSDDNVNDSYKWLRSRAAKRDSNKKS